MILTHPFGIQASIELAGGLFERCARGKEELSSYAVPARASSYAGLPPTITYVGDKDPFYWETQTYVERLAVDGVEVVSTIFEGCYHAFEYIGDGGKIGASARQFTFEYYAEFYDRFAV